MNGVNAGFERLGGAQFNEQLFRLVYGAREHGKSFISNPDILAVLHFFFAAISPFCARRPGGGRFYLPHFMETGVIGGQLVGNECGRIKLRVILNVNIGQRQSGRNGRANGGTVVFNLVDVHAGMVQLSIVIVLEMEHSFAGRQRPQAHDVQIQNARR